ncbi:MAG: ABC-F family ATP-binding cassette domain-containing protein [Fibrobacteres bacterium]|nr:ABC-F family ATP-binding cassette domain-containing protein [Fibrobacterota bacterium]
MIAANNISKQFGEQILFEKATFTLGEGERIGLVGRNGHGKSTLFRLITGEEQPDEGVLQIPRGYTIGFLKQEFKLSQPTVLAEACMGLPDERRHEDWEAKKILAGLGFAEDDFEKSPALFSGGYQIRINLAKVLLSDPHLLLLDEPTNFLDVVSIRWLERYLIGWQNELMVISHDRNFMDKVTTHIMGIHRTKIRKYKGRTHAYYEQISMEEEVHEKQRVNQEKRSKQMELFISRFRAKARLANMVQSRIKALEKQVTLAKLDSISSLSFDFRYQPTDAKYMLDARALKFSYGPDLPLLINNLDLVIEPGDRIGIIGKNGKGKTTLLKLLAGKLKPVNGTVTIHPQIRTSYFEQANTAELHNDATVEDEIMAAMAEPERKKARDICGSMMFTGDSALKKIAVLSGGEKCRVLIGRMLVHPSNLLLLDEPTHHLDLEATESLMEAIGEYEGACAIVTHNERILETVINKLIVFQGGGAFVFDGPYAQFLEEIGWEEVEDGGPSSRRDSASSEKGGGQNKKEQRKQRADLNAKKASVLGPLKKKMEECEKEIGRLEKLIDDEMKALLEASQKNEVAKMVELSTSTERNRKLIETLYDELCSADEQYNQEKSKFDSIEG